MALAPLTLTGWLRYDVVRRVLDRLPDVRSVLEVGAGAGGFATRLAQRFDYVGIERDATSFELATRRLAGAGRGSMVHGDVSALPAVEVFDLVCAFEVLEHQADDHTVLESWAERVRPGGSLMVSVPGFERRYSAWDERAGHYRRYERDQIANLFEKVGLRDPEVVTYGFPLASLLESARNAVAKRRQASGSFEDRTASSARQFQPPDALGAVTRVVAAPFALAQRPFASSMRGMGLVAHARRP